MNSSGKYAEDYCSELLKQLENYLAEKIDVPLQKTKDFRFIKNSFRIG